MDDKIVSRSMVQIFDLTHYEGDWMLPFKEALEGVTAQEAAWKPTPEEASIWEIVNHAFSWTHHIEQRLQGRATEHEDWPPQTDFSEAAWQQTRARLEETLQALRERIAALSADALYQDRQGSTWFRGIMSVVIHNAYHAGQISKLRALWSARQGHQ